MATTADMRSGLIIKVDGSLYSVIEFGQNKTARAAAKVWAKLKGVDNTRTIELTWNSGETIFPVRVEKKAYQYLYKDFWDKDRKFIESFAAEQILGLALVKDFSKEKLLVNEANKLNRIFISRKMYSNIKNFYPKHVLLFNPNILGIQGGRWLNMREDYEDKPNFLVLKFKSYLLFRFLGVKYIIRKRVSILLRRIIPYNGNNSFRSIVFLRRLR